MTILKHSEIDRAYQRISDSVLETPLISNENINDFMKARVFFKLENLQWTGSFKIRGASNKILQLNNNEKDNGVVAFSSGNHAQAVAYISMLNKIKATIIMPKNAPNIKILNTKKYGAKVILYDPEKESREDIAYEIAEKNKSTIIKPYDDYQIIAGQGTAGKEIAKELKDLNIIPDIYLCCCGGGGLIAGTSTYLKYKFPKIKCYSVEPEEFNDTHLSLIKKKIETVKKGSKSICDSLLSPQPGKITFEINKKILSGGLTVSDDEVKKTIIKLAENIKIVTEPGGAVAASALLNKKINVKNKNIVVMISGGNIDKSLFSKIIRKIK